MKQCIMVSIDPDLIDTITDEATMDLWGVFDLPASEQVTSLPVLGCDADWPNWSAQHPEVFALLAVDLPAVRKKLVPVYGADRLASFISRQARVSSNATFGHGIIIQRQADVSAGARLGDYCKIAMGAVAHHDCVIGNFVTLAPGSRLLGNVTVEEGAFIGAAATVLPGITIGEGAVVGAGAIVVKDVAPYTTVIGVPAQCIKPV